ARRPDRRRRAGNPQQASGSGRMARRRRQHTLRCKGNHAKGVAMFTNRKFFEYGGIAASIILVAFGIAAIVLGVNGRSTVQSSLKQEAIVGSPDMTPSAIKAEAKQAGLSASITLPSENIAGKTVDNGGRARAF